MSPQPSDHPKRRGPNESTGNDQTDQQEADWGFESGEEGLSLEKKLGFALVVCLLAGFSFVFYQKYRILQRETVQTETDSPAAGPSDDPDDPDDPSAKSTMVAGKVDSTHAGDSPFYERSSESESDASPDGAWLLASEESSTLPATEPVTSPAINQSSSGTFDPFAEQTSDVPSTPPADPAPQDPPAVTWEEGQFPSAPSPEELVPFEWKDTERSDQAAQSGGQQAAVVEPSPFPAAESTLADAPLPALPPEQVEEPQIPEARVAAESESSMVEQPFPILDQSAATDPEPESAGPLPEITSSEDALPEATGHFDPFSVDEPTAAEAGPGPAPEFPQFPADDGAAAPAPAEPAPVQTAETPEWPFAGTEDRATEPSDWATLPQQQEPNVFEEERALPAEPQAASGPFHAAETSQQSPSASPSADPFASSPTGSSFVPSIASDRAVFGEREITVSHSDSFWSISEREYGTSRYYSALARYNRDRVAQPEQLQSGMTIRIPPPEVLEARFPELLPNRKQKPLTITPTSGTSEEPAPRGMFFDERRQPRYRVGERDTLSSIAEQHLGRASRWTEIYELNRDQLNSPSTLKIGMVLKLPPATQGAIVWPEQDFSR